MPVMLPVVSFCKYVLLLCTNCVKRLILEMEEEQTTERSAGYFHKKSNSKDTLISIGTVFEYLETPVRTLNRKELIIIITITNNNKNIQ